MPLKGNMKKKDSKEKTKESWDAFNEEQKSKIRD